MSVPATPIPERFWPKVNKDGPVPNYRPDLGPCWLWTASTRVGYGAFAITHRQTVGAHRVSYELSVGPIPPGLFIDHLCRTLRCVNPTHLEPVTVAENNARGFGPDAINARKTHCPQGHPLDGENVRHVGGRRQCKTCVRAASRRYMERRRAAA